MVKIRGISPVISIIIVLLITVSLAAAAWTYISGYWGGLVASGIEISSTVCRGGVNATIYIHNMGTSDLNLQNGLDVERTDCPGCEVLVYDPATIPAGETGKIIDTNCTQSGVQQRCSYDILQVSSGRLYQTYTTCYG